MSSEEIVSQGVAPDDALRRPSVDVRYGRAAVFAAALCVLAMFAMLVSQLGWWAMLAGPAYLAATVVCALMARSRVQALCAIAAATASMGLLLILVKLGGLA